MIFRILPVLLTFQFLSAEFPAQGEINWPNFRGPQHTGVAPEGAPPLTWSEESNVKWKVANPGRGSGSPIVWGDRIYLLTAIKTDRPAESPAETTERVPPSRYKLTAHRGTIQLAQAEQPPAERAVPPVEEGPRPGEESRRGRAFDGGGWGRPEAPTNYHQFIVMCLDRNTGATIWQHTACELVPHEGHHGTASYASSSPVTDGKNLYVNFGSRGVYSYTLDGQLRWKIDFGQMTTRNSFGEGSSPAIHGDTVVINWDHEGQSYITALDANTGDTKWKVDRDEETTWLTPLIIEHSGKVQVIVNDMNRARSYDLATGEIIWECGGQAMGAVPTALVSKDLVFCMTGHRGAALYAIPLDSQGDVANSDSIAWKLDQNTPYVPSPLLVEDHLYFLKGNNGILSCYQAESGEPIFKTKRVPEIDMIYSSPVAAAGRIYMCGRNGNTVVAKHGNELEVLATNKLDETIDATPAIVGDQLFIRGEKSLYCISE